MNTAAKPQNFSPPDELEVEHHGVGVLLLFFAVLLFMSGLKLFLGFVLVPEKARLLISIVVTVLYIGAPVFALYRAASYRWSLRLGLAFVVLGVLLHGIFQAMHMQLFGGQGLGGALTLAVRDIGFFTWCVGLGAALSSLLKDRNLLIPVSIFLAGLDIFLVLTPIGFVKRMLEHNPGLVKAASVSVPVAASKATGGVAQIFGTIGPADFVFMAMFFIALYKFGLRTRLTAIWLVPALLAYLCLIFFLPALPLLVPICLTVLIVNATCFKLNGEEWASTALITGIVIALIFWGRSIKPPVEPLPPVADPGAQAQGGSPAPASPNPPR